MKLEIRLECKQPGSYMMAISGELDFEASQSFDRHAQALLGFNPKRVLIDMSGIEYISSNGIGSLFHFIKQLRLQGGVASLFGMQKQVRNVLEAVKVISLQSIFETREECDAFLKELQDKGRKAPAEEPRDADHGI